MKDHISKEVRLNNVTKPKVDLLAKQGRRVEAVKMVKDAASCGLAEAKNYIDVTYPRSFDKNTEDTGVTMDMLLELGKQFRTEFGDSVSFLGVPVTGQPKIGRNEPCPCGKSKKYKKCCGANV